MDPDNIHNRASHGGSKSDFNNGIDVERMIEDSSCGQYYIALENCLVETDRSWRKCQSEVKALQRCNDALKLSKKEAT